MSIELLKTERFIKDTDYVLWHTYLLVLGGPASGSRDCPAMINYIQGDLFAARASKTIILAHACNPYGSWGGGIAARFKVLFPSAYREYADQCQKHGKSLLGKSLVIPTSDSDPGNMENSSSYIACLFTSDFNDSPDDIVEHTSHAMRDLSLQLETLPNVERTDGKFVINMPKINSGIFGVPWPATEATLKLRDNLLINVYTI